MAYACIYIFNLTLTKKNHLFNNIHDTEYATVFVRGLLSTNSYGHTETGPPFKAYSERRSPGLNPQL